MDFIITKASLDKASGEMRWSATASDTDLDVTEEKMSIELYRDFIRRAETKEKPPKPYCTKAWDGGLPYVSVSHYSDLDGLGVAGKATSIYIDGNKLKAKGTFADTDLGRTCFKAVCSDLYGEQKSVQDKIRISIGFLDWAHAHGQVRFERKSLTDRCPMCAEKFGDKTYLSGHLLHLALTRVPANKRTDIMPEMEMKSMTTQKEDAESIVGKELAETLDTEAGKMKSEAFVERAEEQVENQDQQEQSEEVDQSKMDVPSVVSEVKESQTFEERVLASLSDIQALFSEMGKGKKKECMDDEDEEMEKKPAKKSHVLDSAFEALRSAFDQAYGMPGTEQDRLMALQPAFESLGETIKSEFTPKTVPNDTPAQDQPVSADVIAEIVRSAITPVVERIGLLETKLSAQQAAQTVQTATPQRRSIAPTLANVQVQKSAVAESTFDSIARKSVGLM